MSTTFHRVPGETFAGYTQLQVMVCPECGVSYAVPERMVSAARIAGDWKQMWYCPNGHHLGFGERELEKAQRERDRALEREAAQKAFGEQAEASARAQKAAATRARRERDKDRRRVANGVCPCCGRTFKQLARHMQTKHPGYIDEANEAAHSCNA